MMNYENWILNVVDEDITFLSLSDLHQYYDKNTHDTETFNEIKYNQSSWKLFLITKSQIFVENQVQILSADEFSKKRSLEWRWSNKIIGFFALKLDLWNNLDSKKQISILKNIDHNLTKLFTYYNTHQSDNDVENIFTKVFEKTNGQLARSINTQLKELSCDLNL